jgi:hypothetical protein
MDRAVAAAPQQVHYDGAQEGEHRGTDAVGLSIGVLTQLDVAGPVPLVLNAPALPDQAQQGFWSGALTQPTQVSPYAALALAAERVGDLLHDSGATRPVGLDVFRCLSGPQLPDGVAPTALVIRCSERDVTLSLELATDMAGEGLLVGFDGQEHVGPLGEASAKNVCVVWSASAWIRTPSRSRLLSSSFSAERSLDSWVS